MLVHALVSKGLVDAVREEIKPAFHNSGSIDGEYTYSSCHRLNGLWLETIRLTAASTALRYVKEDTVVGNKLLRKGNWVMISARQLHFDEAVFGSDALQFRDNRFLREKGLQRNSSFRPFGGERTLCPGRLLAKQMALMFVALTFHRFDVRLTFPQAFLIYDVSKPAIGIAAGNGELVIDVLPRDYGVGAN